MSLNFPEFFRSPMLSFLLRPGKSLDALRNLRPLNAAISGRHGVQQGFDLLQRDLRRNPFRNSGEPLNLFFRLNGPLGIDTGHFNVRLLTDRFFFTHLGLFWALGHLLLRICGSFNSVTFP